MAKTAPRPWINPKEYREVRLMEARYEAQLARKFMEQGLLRNAAGKAFQAWKAYLAALASEHINELARYFPGRRRLRSGRVVNYVELIVALMPTAKMSNVAQVLDRLLGGGIEALTDIAIKLHEYQYNDIDPSGEVGRYSSEEFVKMDLEKLLNALDEHIKRHVEEK